MKFTVQGIGSQRGQDNPSVIGQTSLPHTFPQLTQGPVTMFSLIPCIHHVRLSKRSKAPQVVKDMMWKTHGKYPDQGQM